MSKFVCDINGVLLAETGIVHGVVAAVAGKDTKQNNEESSTKKNNNISLARRMTQLLHIHENGANYLETAQLPAVSGNSVGGILRRLIVEHSFDVLDVTIEEIFKDMPNHDKFAHDIWFMFNNGGMTPKGSSMRASSLKAYDEIYSIPWLGLLGAVYYGHQFEGSSSFGILYPLMIENVFLYKEALNLSDDFCSKLPSYELLKTLPISMHTRKANSRDNSARVGKKEVAANAKLAKKNKEEAIDNNKPAEQNPDLILEADDPDAMIYGSEYIPAGVQFASLNRCVTNDENVIKAFKAAMGLFLDTHRLIGGKSSAGFGRVYPSYGFDFDYKEAIADYDKMLVANKDDLIRKIRMIATDLKFDTGKNDEKDKKAEKAEKA